MHNKERKKAVNGPVIGADIGGTKTHVGLFVPSRKRPRLLTMQSYQSRSRASLEDILADFVSSHDCHPSAVCIGIAGPVINGICKATNLPWAVSQSKIARQFGWTRVLLVNDLVTTAMATPLLKPNEVLTLNKGRRQKDGTIGLVAPGTGLGQALLVKTESGYVPLPSEGGHSDFAPINVEQAELWKFLHRKYGHVSIERLLSGPGMLNIYLWLRDSGRYREPSWLSRSLSQADPPGVIVKAAERHRTPICKATLRIFVSILGSVSGNLALTTMSTGGIYLGGGIPPRILPFLRWPGFMKGFLNKGRFVDMLARIPINVILNDKAALIGAARMASMRLMI